MRHHRNRQRRRAAEHVLDALDRPATGATPTRPRGSRVRCRDRFDAGPDDAARGGAGRGVATDSHAGPRARVFARTPAPSPCDPIQGAGRDSRPRLPGDRFRRWRPGQSRRRRPRLTPATASRHGHAAAAARSAGRRRRPGAACLRGTDRDQPLAAAASGCRALLRGLADDQPHQAHPGGVLRPDARGRATVETSLPAPVAAFAYIDVSLQRAAAGPAHSGDSVLRGPTAPLAHASG